MAKTGFFLRSGETWRSPWDDYRALRNDSPILFVPAEGDNVEFWVLSRFADVFAAVRDTAMFSSAQGLTPNADAMSMFEAGQQPIVMMDPPDHTVMRRLVSRQMTPRRVAQIEHAVREFVDTRLDRVADAGQQPVDIVDALFKPLPSFVVAHYLGVPPNDRDRFDGWTDAIVSANAVGAIETAMDAALALFAYATELMERKKVEPGEDLVTDLVESGDDVVSPGWITGFIFTMVTGGNDTMTGMLSGSAELLTDHRDERQRLLDDRSLMESAVEELLRLTSPVQNLARTTTTDVELHGCNVPAGDKVLLLYGSANRDEREFGASAGDLDVGRAIDRTVSLGYGAHHCLGASAARLQGRVALDRLLERFPFFEVDSAGGRFAPGGFVRRYESLPFTA